MEEVEVFIQKARDEAVSVQGSGLSLARTHSQASFHHAIAQIFQKLKSKGAAELQVGHIGELICDILKLVYVEDEAGRRLKPTARKKNLFPLPTSGWQVSEAGGGLFLQAVLASPNSLQGVALSGPDNSVTNSAVKRMAAIIQGSTILQEP